MKLNWLCIFTFKIFRGKLQFIRQVAHASLWWASSWIKMASTKFQKEPVKHWGSCKSPGKATYISKSYLLRQIFHKYYVKIVDDFFLLYFPLFLLPSLGHKKKLFLFCLFTLALQSTQTELRKPTNNLTYWFPSKCLCHPAWGVIMFIRKTEPALTPAIHIF